MLDLIQKTLASEGFCYQRIDGRTSLDNRSKSLNEFDNNPNCTIMLASIGSAGEG
jgi:SNF2 family DNA or RNA helicase